MNSRIRCIAPRRLVECRPLSLRIALALLALPLLGRSWPIKRVAGQLLKRPARRGVVLAQSRLGALLCRDSNSACDRRIGLDLLRQAARVGDLAAQLQLAHLYALPRLHEPAQVQYWLEQAAAQGSTEAREQLNLMQ